VWWFNVHYSAAFFDELIVIKKALGGEMIDTDQNQETNLDSGIKVKNELVNTDQTINDILK